MKTIKLLSLLLLINTLVIAQEMEWVKAIGGIGSDTPRMIASDNSGNVYTAGTFMETVDFNPGIENYELSSNGHFDVFLQKLDTSGDFLWSISVGGLENDILESITIDNTGNIIIIGYFEGSVDFDPGINEYFLNSIDEEAFFILKLNSNGEFIWAKSLDSPNIYTYKYSISIDNNEDLIISGSFEGTVDFDFGSGVFNATSNGETDMFILKINANGEFIWVKTIGGDSNENSTSLVINNNGEILITGKFYSEIVDFDPGNNVTNLFNNEFKSIFILKLDLNGNFIWAKSIESTGINTDVFSIASDAVGNSFITGGFQNTIDFDPGSGIFNLTANGGKDIYILKLDADGNYSWAQAIGSTGEDEHARSITTDNMGNILITGKFMETVDFDSSSSVANLTVNGYKDCFILKLTTNGDFIWVRSVGGPGFDAGTSIATDFEGNILVSGSFKSTADLDPGQGIINYTSNGHFDIFIMKLNDNTLGFDENELVTNVSFYPNPTYGKISLLLGKTYQKIEVSITNSLGQQLLTTTKTNKDKIEVKLNASSGLYYCTIILDEKIKTTLKVIKN